MSQEKKQCPVCYEDLTIENAVNLPCNHSQCSKCFWKWTNEQGKQSCCMCRSEYLTHKNHQLNANVEEANNALEWARRSLAECVRREEQIRLKVEDLYDEERHKEELIENLQHIHNHEKAKIEKLEELYYHRMRECHNLGCSLPSEGHKMSDDMLSLFYERRHKKRLDIAQKKRDGRYKKVLAELNDYIKYERRTKIVLKVNCIHFVHEILEIKRRELGIYTGDSTWMFEEDETNYGFWVTQAQTTMKPVYADIRMNKSKPSWMVSQNFMVWSPGNYERKIVNWLKPDDYAEPNWDRNELLHFRRWRKRLVKALRLTRDIKTEKGHRERNIDVVENRITRAYKTKNNIKINNENGLGDYGMSMFDEPPAFAGAETRLSLCMWTEYDGPNHGNHRPVLEEGEIDEIREDYSDDNPFDDIYSGSSDTSSTDSSMPELIDEDGNVVDEDEIDHISIPSINTREDITNHIEILQHIFTLQE